MHADRLVAVAFAFIAGALLAHMCAAAGSSTAASRATDSSQAQPITSTNPIAEYDSHNPFKGIVEGKLQAYKLFETEHTLAFLDLFPRSKGHALIIPKASGYATIMSMPEEVAAQLFAQVPRLSRAIADATGCDGLTVRQQNGKASGQSVFHMHVHLVPVYETGEPHKGWISRADGVGNKLDPKEAQELVKSIKAKLEVVS